jgi:hypothetical protein
MTEAFGSLRRQAVGNKLRDLIDQQRQWITYQEQMCGPSRTSASGESAHSRLMRSTCLVKTTIGRLGVLFSPQPIEAGNDYPLVFTSSGELEKLGLSLGRPLSQFMNRCYVYGEGSDAISLSDSLLRFYKSEGFSLRTACMALVSGVVFNPETGKHLTTYTSVNPGLFKNGRPDPALWDAGEPRDLGQISGELPLSLPSCFKNARPFRDCVWRYDPLTGEPLSESEAKKYDIVGSIIDKAITAPATRETYVKSPLKRDEDGFTQVTANMGDSPWAHVLFEHHLYGELAIGAFFDFGSDFPSGYGYAALFTNDGSEGGILTPELIQTVVESQKHPPKMVDVSQLAEIWRTGSN